MKKFNILTILMVLAIFAFIKPADAQVWEPEGISMPGLWNSWTNPPVNNLALASYTQVPGGLVTKITNGTDARWNTTLHVAAAGGDVVGGTYEWLFTSGPDASPWNNKWSAVNVSMNTIQTYTKEGAANNSATLANDKWYVVNFEDQGYIDTRAIFMEVSAEPVDILTVSEPVNPMPNTAYAIDITLSANPSPEEVFYVRYTTDNWTSSAAVAATMAGTSGSATIPGQAVNTQVDYYAFSSSVSGITGDYSLYTMRYNNNAGSNYSYTIGNPPPPTIGWCNMQWPPNGSIDVGQDFTVYGQIWLTGVTDGPGQGADMQAWIGWSDTDSDPSTWTNWAPATFNVDQGSNDEYMANLGTAVSQAGTFYYAYRYQYLDQAYVYGGYQGGFWDGTNNVSGVLTVSHVIPLSNWAMVLFGVFFLTFFFFKFRK